MDRNKEYIPWYSLKDINKRSDNVCEINLKNERKIELGAPSEIVEYYSCLKQ